MVEPTRTRKLPLDGKDEHQERKRRRLTLEGAFCAPPSSPIVSFDSLNSDCLVHILSFLKYETMNTVAVCSRACREARSNEYLDQTRTGTIIVCSERATVRSIYEILVRWKQSNILGGHPIHLIIENASNISPDPEDRSVTFGETLNARFTRVMSIDLSIDQEHAAAADRQVAASSLECIFRICGESRAIDMSGLKIGDVGRLFVVIAMDCRRLGRLTWNNAHSDEILFGNSHLCRLENVTLSIDDSCFQSAFPSADMTRRMFEQPSFIRVHFEWYLMMHCMDLTVLSIKNVTWYSEDNPQDIFPLSQEMLMKMVRNHPTLQWLRSDLSAENVAILQQERPDITFVLE